MISDTLSDSIDEIDQYLNDMDNVCCGNIRRDILELRDKMETMRGRLDSCGDSKASFNKFKGIREIAPGSVPRTVAMVFCQNNTPKLEKAINSICKKSGFRIKIYDQETNSFPFVVLLPLDDETEISDLRRNCADEKELLDFLNQVVSKKNGYVHSEVGC